jgi:hypothetical protein
MGRDPPRILQAQWYKSSCEFSECSLHQALRKLGCEWIQRCKLLLSCCQAAPVHISMDSLIVSQEIPASFFETYPDRKYLINTKPDVQEVALTKAVIEAKIKLAPALWKEVIVQMKAITGEDFAAPSLRKRYEDIERRQFFLSEQNPAKDDQWPPLSTSSNLRAVHFDGTPKLVPVAADNFNSADHAHGRKRRNRDMSSDTDSAAEDIDYVKRFNTVNGQKRSAVINDPKVKFEDMLRSRQAIEKENVSPSHTHPSSLYTKIEKSVEMGSDGFAANNMGLRTPTPVTAVGMALKGTGIGSNAGAGPRPGLVGYGDSDDDSD